MKRLGLALSTLASAILLSAGLSAQEAPAEAAAATPNPARELFTTSAGVTEPGVAMLNLGFQSTYERDKSEARCFPSQLALGLTSWIDVRVAWSGLNTVKDPDGHSESGGGDPQIGSQLQFLRQDRAGLDLGLAYWHKLPRASVDKGIGSGKADDTLLATASRIDGPWQLDLNAGANWIGRQEGDGRVREGVVSLAVTRGLAPDWSASLDTYAVAGTELGPRTVASILAVNWQVHPRLTVDLGVEAGLTRSAQRFAIDAGLVWRVGRLWGQDN
jgi:hypothetical protein